MLAISPRNLQTTGDLARQLIIRVIAAWTLHAATLLLIRIGVMPQLFRPAALLVGIVIVCQPFVTLALSAMRIEQLVRPFGVMMIYAVPSVLFFVPLLPILTTHVLGGSDTYQVMWDAWWIKQVVTAGKPLFFSDAVFAPVGAPLIPHLIPIQSTLIALLELIFSDTVAFNIVVFLAIPVAGLGAYALCRSLDFPKPASIAAGFVFAWSPFLSAKLGWLNLSY